MVLVVVLVVALAAEVEEVVITWLGVCVCVCVSVYLCDCGWLFVVVCYVCVFVCLCVCWCVRCRCDGEWCGGGESIVPLRECVSLIVMVVGTAVALIRCKKAKSSVCRWRLWTRKPRLNCHRSGIGGAKRTPRR